MARATGIAAILLAGATIANAPPAPRPLPGVSDSETTIPFDYIEQFVRGNGDTLFVRDPALRWYRMELDRGCVPDARIEALAFEPIPGRSRIDTHTPIRLIFGAMARPCRIASIRRSEAPKEVDSKSRVLND